MKIIEQLKGEEEIDAIFRNQEAELAYKNQQIKEERAQKELAKQQAEEERKQKELAIEAQKNIQIQFARYLLQSGKPIEEIILITGLDKNSIEQLSD